ncbi:Fc.00g006200.m01.CDS01 [Cosmosporella sp. VM-42]
MVDALLRLLSGPRSRAPGCLSSPQSEPALGSHSSSSQRAEDYPGPQSGDNCTVSSGPPAVGAKRGNGLVVKDLDGVWHNPSADQMARALRAAVLSKGVLELLPVKYHSYILNLIEAFSIVKGLLASAEGHLAKSKDLRRTEVEERKTRQEDWRIREARYKTEIRRLELAIYQMSDSRLEAVALVRSQTPC